MFCSCVDPYVIHTTITLPDIYWFFALEYYDSRDEVEKHLHHGQKVHSTAHTLDACNVIIVIQLPETRDHEDNYSNRLKEFSS